MQLSLRDLNKIDPELKRNLAHDTQSVCAANGGGLGPVGKLQAKLTLMDRSFTTTLHVFSGLRTSLLSKQSCIQLGLLEEGWPHSRLTQHVSKLSLGSGTPTIHESATTSHPDPRVVQGIKHSILQNFSKAFMDEPFRAMTGPIMHIDLEEGAVPCRPYRARDIPFRWREAAQQQLNAMEAKEIIQKVPVGESLTWCHPMVVVSKAPVTLRQILSVFR